MDRVLSKIEGLFACEVAKTFHERRFGVSAKKPTSGALLSDIRDVYINKKELLDSGVPSQLPALEIITEHIKTL